jgi:hypothetical protein
MKKIILLFQLLIIFDLTAYSQVFNTSSTLKPGIFNLGFEPGLYLKDGTDAYFFLHGGLGIMHGVDLSAKIGLGGYEPYIGGDAEFSFGKNFSFSVGAHSWGVFGLDATALYTFLITKSAKLYTGLDSDLYFNSNNEVVVWIPVGIDIAIQKSIYLIFDTEINITNNWGHFLGVGLDFVF